MEITIITESVQNTMKIVVEEGVHKLQNQYEKTKMSRTEFGDELCKQILKILGEGYRTELSQVEKNNGVKKDVLYVRREDSECVPCFYMDELYYSYENGENEIGLAEYLTNIVLHECGTVEKQTKECLKKEWIMERLFIRLIHYEKNKHWLKDAVYIKFLDFAAVFYVLTEDGEMGVKSYRLPKKVWETLELGTEDAYYPKVLENTRRLFPEILACIETVLEELEGGFESGVHVKCISREEKLIPNRLYVLSNRRKINGASTLLYPQLLKELGERFSGNYYIIPSSVHEVLLIKETEEENAELLNHMVCEVNEQQVAPEEVLSDHVYLYSVKEAKLLCR